MVEDKQPLPDLIAPSLREDERRREAAWADVTHARRGADEVAAERRAAGDSPEEIELARSLYTPRELDERLLELMAPTPAPAANDAGPGRAIALALAAAAAAVAMFWFVGHDGPEPRDPAPMLAALPAYTLDPGGGLETQRGAHEPPATGLRYRPSNHFTWRLRPDVEVEGDVELRVCVAAKGREARPLELDAGLIEIKESGAIQVRGPVSALGLEPGRWTATLIIVQAEALDPRELRCDAPEGPGRQVHALEFELMA